MPEYSFVEIDTLDFAGSANVADACRDAVADALSDASAVISHGAAAKFVLEAVAAKDPQMPVLLLSPMYVVKSTALLRIFRSIIATPGARLFLAKIAKDKLARLRSNPGYLKEQLATLVGPDFITDALIDEATARIHNSRTEPSVKRTAEIVLSVTEPLEPSVNAAVQNRSALLGSSLSDKKMARKIIATTLPDVVSAAMIEAPDAVADVIRKMLAAAEKVP